MSWVIEAGKLEAKRFLSYRVDFWLQFLVTAFAEVVIAYYLWGSIYGENRTQLIGGYNFHQMLLYYIYVPLIGRIVRSQEDWSTAREIYEGTLTKFLIFPLSFIQYKFLQKFVYSSLTVLQMVIALLCVRILFQFEIPFTLTSFALGFVAAFASMLLYSTIGTMLELFAFWAETVWSLGVMLRFIAMFFGGAMIPLSLFSGVVAKILFMSPFPYMFATPIKTFLGEYSAEQALQGIGITIIWILPMWLIMMLVYRKGLSQYTGVGI